MVAKNNPRKRPLPDGYLCFSLDGTSRSQKSAYSEERKEQVHEVRKIGACLRCQLLKKSCSKGSPCDTCVRAAAKNSASRSLAWMECLRPSLQNVTIYGTENRAFRSLHLGGVPVLQYLAHGELDLKFDIPFTWNIDELTTFVAGWLSNDHDAPRASMVGIMSSASLLSAISGLVGAELAQVFKALIHTSSLIFNSPAKTLTYSEQSTDMRILQYCGQKLLRHFDVQMKPTTLARLRKQELYAMFLMLLGSVMASKYISETLGDLELSRLTTGQSSLSPGGSDQPGYELVRLLSHQLVYVGQAVGLLHENLVELIKDLTMKRWQTTRAFRPEATPSKLPSTSTIDATPEPSRHTIERISTSGRPHAATGVSSGSKGAYGASLRTFSGNHIRHAWYCDPLPNTSGLRYLREARKQCACETHLTRFRPTTLTEALSRSSNRNVTSTLSHIPDCARFDSMTAPNMDLKLHVAESALCADPVSQLVGFGSSSSSTTSTLDWSSEMHIESDNSTVHAGLFQKLEGQTEAWDISNQTSDSMPTPNDAHPSSPIDINVAPFDPDLPTLGLDTMFSQADAGEQWAFLSRVPSPSPVESRFTFETQTPGNISSVSCIS